MPKIFTIQSDHIEGENIRTLGRVVGLDQAMVSSDDAGPLTIKIQSKGQVVYTKTIAAGSATGILDTPTTPEEWTKRGSVNFDFTFDADQLKAESPSFKFKGGRSYLIVYDWDSELHGHIIGHHRVGIVPSP